MYKLLIIMFMLFSCAFAQDELLLNNTNYNPNYFSMLFGLAFVICLIYLTGIVYKKLVKIKLDNSQDDENSIQIVSSASLGQNKNLFIVKVNSEYSLIGATQNSITHIKDIKINHEN